MPKKKTKTKKSDIKMSVPEGMEFDTPYNMDHTLHSEYYWDTTRNVNLTACGDHFTLPFDECLDMVVAEITTLLKEKNIAYGNTALNPTNIFSRLNASEAICARLDDKLARIKNKGINDQTEDTVDDLIGYLLLLKMSM